MFYSTNYMTYGLWFIYEIKGEADDSGEATEEDLSYFSSLFFDFFIFKPL